MSDTSYRSEQGLDQSHWEHAEQDELTSIQLPHGLFDIAHIPMHIAAIGPQIENGITDELPGAVIRDVAAAARFMNSDAALVEFVRRGEEVRLRRVQLHAERDDVRMLQQQEKIGHRTRAPLLHQRALQLHGIRVWHDAEPADF